MWWTIRQDQNVFLDCAVGFFLRPEFCLSFATCERMLRAPRWMRPSGVEKIYFYRLVQTLGSSLRIYRNGYL